MMMGKIEAAVEVTFGWAIVRTYAGQERLAQDALQHRGFEVYLPMTLREDVRQKRLLAVPFVPNYLFVKLSPAAPDWWLMLSTRGVHSLLGARADGRPPLLLRDEALQKFRERQEGAFIKIAARPTKPVRPEYEKGQRLAVAGGLLDRLEVVFEEFVDEKRAMLIASLPGHSDSRRKLFIDWRDLRAPEN
jgi:transcription antitermination factor NusG